MQNQDLENLNKTIRERNNELLGCKYLLIELGIWALELVRFFKSMGLDNKACEMEETHKSIRDHIERIEKILDKKV